MFDDRGLNTIYNHAPHAKLANDFIKWPSAHEEFLSRIRYEPIINLGLIGDFSGLGLTETVQGRAEDHKSVALSLVHCSPVLLCELIGAHEKAQSEHTDQSSLQSW
jgi:hypothetical protein